MATVMERFDKLGIAHSNPVLQRAGEHVKSRMRTSAIKGKKLQVEDGEEYWVNDYHEHVTNDLDLVIIAWVKSKPTSYQQLGIRQWWQHYKEQREYSRLNTQYS